MRAAWLKQVETIVAASFPNGCVGSVHPNLPTTRRPVR
jgi:hypothetical protein